MNLEFGALAPSRESENSVLNLLLRTWSFGLPHSGACAARLQLGIARARRSALCFDGRGGALSTLARRVARRGRDAAARASARRARSAFRLARSADDGARVPRTRRRTPARRLRGGSHRTCGARTQNSAFDGHVVRMAVLRAHVLPPRARAPGAGPGRRLLSLREDPLTGPRVGRLRPDAFERRAGARC